jgi:aldehyde dehydrogenase (NAD+)
MSAPIYTHKFDHAGFKGDVEVPLGLFIDNEWSTSKDSAAKTIE